MPQCNGKGLSGTGCGTTDPAAFGPYSQRRCIDCRLADKREWHRLHPHTAGSPRVRTAKPSPEPPTATAFDPVADAAPDVPSAPMVTEAVRAVREHLDQQSEQDQSQGGEKMETTHTVGAQELGRVLHNAALFASKDTVRPILCGVEISINGKVEATATDSYRLGHDECPVLTGSGEATMVLEAKELAAIAKELLKVTSYTEVTITTADAIVPGGMEGTEVTIKMPGRTWVLSSVYGTFPSWKQLIPSGIEGEVSTIGLNAELLATFARVNDGTGHKAKRPLEATPMRLRFQSELKPVLVSIGQTFTGVIMPIRLSN